MKYQFIYYVKEYPAAISINADSKKDADRILKALGLGKIAFYQEKVKL
jgi:hypothetical protein